MIWIMTIIPFYIIYSHGYNHLYNPIFLYQCKLYGAPKMGPCWPWSGGLWKEAIRLFQHLEAGLYLDKSWIRVWNFQDLHLTLLQDDHVYIYIKQYIYMMIMQKLHKIESWPPMKPKQPPAIFFFPKGHCWTVKPKRAWTVCQKPSQGKWMQFTNGEGSLGSLPCWIAEG